MPTRDLICKAKFLKCLYIACPYICLVHYAGYLLEGQLMGLAISHSEQPLCPNREMESSVPVQYQSSFFKLQMIYQDLVFE